MAFSSTAEARALADQPVLNRMDPALERQGWRQGALIFLPHIRLEQRYTDNLRASHDNRQDDFVSVLAPALHIKTEKNRFGFDGVAEVRQMSYWRNSGENNTNALLGWRPYYNLSRSLQLKGHMSYTYQHELRTVDTASPSAIAPTAYDQTMAGLSLLYKPGRAGVEIFANHERLSFRNVATFSGGRFINDDRNRVVDTGGLELSCDLAGESRVGWRSEGFRQDYTRADYNLGSGLYDGITRDNTGWRSVLNMSLKPTRLLDLKGYIGVETRSFDYTPWPARTVPVAEAKLLYRLTPLTNIVLDLEQKVIDTGFDQTPAFMQRQAGIGLIHELRRHLVLNLDGHYGQADYGNHPREDDLYGGNLGLSYKQNRYLSWRAQYRYQKRDSSFMDASYHENMVMLGTQVQF